MSYQTKKKYKAGLIGYGYWGPVLLRNFNNSEHFDVLRVCDHNPEKLKKVKDISRCIEICTDHNKILKDDAIDVVIIATQAGTHCKLVLEALKNNKNVFVEKPLALNAQDAVAIINANQKKKKIIMADHTYLFSQPYKKIKLLVESGILGDILHFHSTRADFGLFQKDANVLWHLLYHDVYILLDLFGQHKIKGVRASGASHIINKIEDAAYAAIQYVGGQSADILVNMLFPFKERKIIIAGSKKILYWDDTAEDKLKIYHKSAVSNKKHNTIEYDIKYAYEKIPVPRGEALKTEIDYFTQCLNDKIVPLNDEKSAYKAIKLLEVIEAALREKWVGIKK